MKNTVNIHGKEYETVASRVSRFREEYKFDYSIETEIVSIDDIQVVIKATIKDKDGRVVATGHAEEKRNASTINRTSALENCETSAIGRCLASFGFLGTEFATADEVAQAIHEQGLANGTRQHAKVKPDQRMAQYTKAEQEVINVKKELFDAFVDKDITNVEEMKKFYTQVLGRDDVKTLKEAKQVLTALKEG